MQDKNYKQMWTVLKTLLETTAAIAVHIKTSDESDPETKNKAQVIELTACTFMEMMDNLEENGIPTELAEVLDAMDAIAAAEDEDEEEGSRDAC